MPVKVVLKRFKECKGSVRFDSADEESPVQSLYVSRKVPGVNDAKAITVTVETH